jgi:hypothetical protein
MNNILHKGGRGGGYIFGCLNYQYVPWQDFAIVQKLIVTTNEKMFNVKNL